MVEVQWAALRCHRQCRRVNKLGLQLGTQAGVDEVNENLSGNNKKHFEGLEAGPANTWTDKESYGYDAGPVMTLDDVIAMADFLKSGATAIAPGNYTSDFGTPGSPEVYLADGDISLGGSGKGFGILIVTGELSISGGYIWEGLILVVGDGVVSFSGSDHTVYGAVLVAATTGGTPLPLPCPVGADSPSPALRPPERPGLSRGESGGVSCSGRGLARLGRGGMLGVAGGSLPGCWMQGIRCRSGARAPFQPVCGEPSEHSLTRHPHGDRLRGGAEYGATGRSLMVRPVMFRPGPSASRAPRPGKPGLPYDGPL